GVQTCALPICAFARQGALPVRRTADIGALRPPGIQRAVGRDPSLARGEHGLVDFAELLGLDAALDDGVDFLVGGPDVLERYGPALGVVSQRILFDVEAYGAGDGIGHDQRR